MRINFVVPSHPSRPPDLICEAEVFFDEGPLEGLKLVGIGLWKSRNPGGIKVTMPARAFRTGHERGYFDFLRSQDPDNQSAEARFKQEVIDAWHWREERQRKEGRG